MAFELRSGYIRLDKIATDSVDVIKTEQSISNYSNIVNSQLKLQI